MLVCNESLISDFDLQELTPISLTLGRRSHGGMVQGLEACVFKSEVRVFEPRAGTAEYFSALENRDFCGGLDWLTLLEVGLGPAQAAHCKEKMFPDGYIFPKGCEALIPVLEVQRSEKYWPNPLKFDPDRFLPEEVAKRHPYSYLAFSAGPRNCIGKTAMDTPTGTVPFFWFIFLLGFRYAIMAMKTLAVTMLRRYTLKKDNIVPVKDIRLRLETTIKTIHPITVRIEKRIRDWVAYHHLPQPLT